MFEQWYYLLGLSISLAGLVLLDYRHTLVFWLDSRRALLTLGASSIIFVIWDMAGIGLGIFEHGNGKYTLPFRLAPEFPLEEVCFLILLCYVTLIMYQAGKRLWQRI